MDRPVNRTPQRPIFKEFEYPDLIPYSIALLTVLAGIYLVIALPALHS